MCVWCLLPDWERWAGDTHKALVRGEVSKWEELTIIRPGIQEFPVNQVKVARLALSSRNLPWELPPRQGDLSDRGWMYFLGHNLKVLKRPPGKCIVAVRRLQGRWLPLKGLSNLLLSTCHPEDTPARF